MHTAKLDSAVGCTPWSLTLRYDAHWGAFKNSNISAKSKPNLKILYCLSGAYRWVQSIKKIEVENLVTHPFKCHRVHLLYNISQCLCTRINEIVTSFKILHFAFAAC